MDLWGERKRMNLVSLLVLVLLAPCSCFQFAGSSGQGLLRVRVSLEASAYTRSRLALPGELSQDTHRIVNSVLSGSSNQ